MSPDPQQQTISIEAVQATCNELGSARLLINDLTVRLTKALELLKRCADEHGPKAEDGTNATDADMTPLDDADVPASLDGPRPMLRRKGG